MYNKEDKYLVIDPSNATFSQILAGAHDNIRVCFSNKLQIYKPAGKTGNDLNLWRDCIDVAVKLAFNLSTNLRIGLEDIRTEELSKNVGCIPYDSLKSSITVQGITNQLEIYRKLPDIVQYESARRKQSSDVSDSKKTTAFLTALDCLFKNTELELEERGMTHLLSIFKHIKTSLPKKIFDKENREKSLEEWVEILEIDLLPEFHNLIGNDVLLLRQEFDTIDNMMKKINMTGETNDQGQ